MAGVVVEIFLELAFDNAALFFDDEHFVFVLYKLECAIVLQRPDHAHLVNVNTHFFGIVLIDTDQSQRFHQIEMGLAGGYDAEACVGDIEYFSVDRVCCGESERCCFLGFQAFFDLWAREVRPSIMQAVCGHFEVFRYYKLRIRW